HDIPVRMIRVLHLCETTADYQTTSAIRSLESDASGSVQVQARTIGRGGDFSLPIFALIALRRSGAPEFDLLHAWGPAAPRAASYATRAPIVYTPGADPGRTEIAWLRSAVEHRDVQVICP